MDIRSIVRRNATLNGLKTSIDKGQTGFLLKRAKDASPWFFASNRYKNILNKVKEYHETPLESDNPLSKDNEKKFVKLDEMKQAIDVYKREKISDGFIDENWNLKRNVSGKDLERILLVKDMETYANRIEQEKKLAEEQEKIFSEKKKRVNDINDFVGQKKAYKELVVNKQLQKEIAQQEKEGLIKDDSVFVSDNISNDINLNNNIINNNNNIIQEEEVDINKDIQVDIEEEKVIQDKDIEKDM